MGITCMAIRGDLKDTILTERHPAKENVSMNVSGIDMFKGLSNMEMAKLLGKMEKLHLPMGAGLFGRGGQLGRDGAANRGSEAGPRFYFTMTIVIQKASKIISKKMLIYNTLTQ